MVRERYEKYSGEKFDKEKKGMIEEYEAKLKGMGYSEEEINELITKATRANTYVGIKDAEIRVLEKTDIKGEINRIKRAGVSKAVLLKGEGIKEIEEETINQIKEMGIYPIIGITKGTTKEGIEKYKKIKSVYGFRMLEENEQVKEEDLKKIMEEGKEISYKMKKYSKTERERMDYQMGKKVIYVLEAEKIVKDNIKEIKELAKEGRLSIYFETDEKKYLEKAKGLVEKIFGEGINTARTMISVGKTYVGNEFARLIKKDIATIYFTQGYESENEELFKDEQNMKEIMELYLKKLLCGNMTEEELKGMELGEKLTEEHKKKIEEIRNEKELKEGEKIVALRQLMMGSMVSYIERKMEKSYGKTIEMRMMKVETKRYIVSKILQGIMNGESLEEIKEKLEKTKGLEEQITIREQAKAVIEQKGYKDVMEKWNKTDVVMGEEGITAEEYKNIKILMEDNLKPLGMIEKIEQSGMMEGIKSALKAA